MSLTFQQHMLQYPDIPEAGDLAYADSTLEVSENTDNTITFSHGYEYGEWVKSDTVVNVRENR